MGGYHPVSGPVATGRFRLHRFDVLDSTQSEAKRGAYTSGDVIMAVHQTGAYGRRGRAWQAPEGNLFFTYLDAYTDPSLLNWIPYAVGLALYDAVFPQLKTDEELRLKWPNDLLIQKKKLSGILIEVRDETLVIGIGLNVVAAPITDQPVTCLHAHSDHPVSADDVLHAYLQAYEHWFQQGMAGGFSAIRSAWLERAAFIGETITARLADGSTLTGIFDTLDVHGGLVLRTESAHHTITTADIFLT